ncbi:MULTISPECIES: hypothetical protein [Olivibacter]|uniref:Outer membrane protein beta-barrel domain-containing protein n=1 Tax=Olivibacter jilunii TaxID=985016 RepID=A0ABW6BAY0_9SPHI|nr:hypothetical protein [Olivibacter sp. UJ_SKK_5.1]MDX3912800.1 hypothetical protein [Pseudosphingobacterium sp.]
MAVRQVFFSIHKVLLLLFLLLILSRREGYAQFSRGVAVELGSGVTQLHGEMKEKPFKVGYHIGFDYMMSPYLSAGVQGMVGRLAANDRTGRQSTNNYLGANFNVKARMGLLSAGSTDNFELNYIREHAWRAILRNVYIGTGLGFIHNDVDANRGGESAETNLHLTGQDNSSGMFVPINVGVDVPFGYTLSGPIWSVNLNAQLGLYFGDEMDGYANAFSKHNDRMFYFSIAVKKSLFNRSIN